jgi:hypothetical protein
MSSERYHASESIISGIFLLAFSIGGLIFFGSLWLEDLRDLRAFPDAPEGVTVAEAASIAKLPHSRWVRLIDARILCQYAPRSTQLGSDVFAFVTDATEKPRVLVSMTPPGPASCGKPVAPPMVGVLRGTTPGRIVGLEWPGLDWQSFPTQHLNVLWTRNDPSETRGSVWVLSMFFPLILFMFLGALYLLRRGLAARRPLPPVLAEVAFAMPLSTGASALGLSFVPLVLWQIVLFGPLFFGKYLPDWTVYPIGILWAAWFFTMLVLLVDGWKRRASDLLIGKNELAVRGGPLHRTRIAFRDLDPACFTLKRPSDAEAEAYIAYLKPDQVTLWLDGEVAAVCRDEDEARSLAVLVETVHALHAQAVGAWQPPVLRPPGVVYCEVCGAPVAPRKEEQAQCGHCGADVAIPTETRAALAAQEGLAAAHAQSERILRQLLSQPGAHRTNLLIVVSIPPLFVGWPLCGILFDELYQGRNHLFSWLHGVSLLIAAFCFTYGLSWLLRAHIAARAAVRVVATRFAAIPPTETGDPSACRNCGGPLPLVSSEQLLVSCLYCQSENVLGTYLLPAVRREEGQARNLGEELIVRLAERRRYRLIALASLLLLLLSVASFLPAWRVY